MNRGLLRLMNLDACTNTINGLLQRPFVPAEKPPFSVSLATTRVIAPSSRKNISGLGSASLQIGYSFVRIPCVLHGSKSDSALVLHFLLLQPSSSDSNSSDGLIYSRSIRFVVVNFCNLWLFFVRRLQTGQPPTSVPFVADISFQG